MTPNELIEWLQSLDPTSTVHINEDGMCLIEVNSDGDETDRYLEVGGFTPEERE